MLKYAVPMICLVTTPLMSVHAEQVVLPRTGQTNCYNASGSVVNCASTGQDGEIQAGVALPSPRFTDNENGTVTDNLTGLIWLKDANCTDTSGGIIRPTGLLDWESALNWTNSLVSGKCGLSDNSAAGDWRLPNINELRSIIDYSRHDPGLSEGHPFRNVQQTWYWSSTTNPVYTSGAYTVGLSRGSVHVERKFYGAPGSSRVGNKIGSALGVWPVRYGRHRAVTRENAKAER